MTSGSGLSRKRNRNGQFISDKEPTENSARQLERRRERSRQNKTDGTALYSMYLDACFLKGDIKRDWVMADSNIGPLAEAAAALLKPSFLPFAKDRCDRVRKRYFNFEEGKKQKDIKQEYILDGNNVNRKRQRRRIFKGWRLPRLGWDDEVGKIKDWIDECFRYRALKVTTKEEAYEIIRKLFVQCKQHKFETFYEGYPPEREEEVNEVDIQKDESSEQNDREQATVSSRENTRDTDLSQDHDEGDFSVAQSARELFETAPVHGDIAYSSHIRRIIRAARNDRLFFFLCNISENVAECKMDCIAAAILDVCKAEDLKCDILVIEALRYASARQKGAEDLESFRLQRHRVQTNAELLKIARASIPGARPYEDLAWADFPLNILRPDSIQLQSTPLNSGNNRPNFNRVSNQYVGSSS